MPEDNEFAGTSGKLISLRGHRLAEQLLDDLFGAGRTDPRYNVLVAKSANLGPPTIAAIIRRADASQPEGLFVLADITSRYPSRSRMTQALVRASLDRHHPDSRRAGAALLLAFHDFGPSVPALGDLLAGLNSPPLALSSLLIVALQSYAQVEAPILDDYHTLFSLILSLPPELLYSAVLALADSQDDGVVDVLGLLALHPHPDITRTAIEALTARRSVEAVALLLALEPNLPVDAAHTVSRVIQKLRLSGSRNIPDTAVPDERCLAWLSAIDGTGRRNLVLEWPTGIEAAHIKALDLTLTEQDGLTRATARTQLNTGSESQVGLLSVPYMYALRVLRDAVSTNRSSSTHLPIEYQIAFQHLWKYGTNDAVSHDSWGIEILHEDISTENESDLLSQEHFALWYVSSPGTYFVASELAATSKNPHFELTDETWHMLLPSIIRLAHDEFIPELRARYASRLRLMSEWLFFAGQREQAVMAASAARTMIQSPPEANLFVLRLVQKGILVALSKLP